MDRIKVGAYTLHFGMTAVRIWQEKCEAEVLRLKGGKPDNVKAFVYLVYAGLCNYQDTLEDGVHPTYSEAYEIAENILFMDDKVQNDVWECFQNSRAGKPLLDKLKALTKEEKKSPAKGKIK